MKTELDAEGMVKICWSEFEDCLKFFSKTAPFYKNAKERYHNSIQILLGRIKFLEEQRDTHYAQKIKEVEIHAPRQGDAIE